jgi:hypothetical protein
MPCHHDVRMILTDMTCRYNADEQYDWLANGPNAGGTDAGFVGWCFPNCPPGTHNPGGGLDASGAQIAGAIGHTCLRLTTTDGCSR